MGRSRAVGRHLSAIESHYKLVGHVLIGEAKSAMKNKGKVTKVKRNLTRPRQLKWHAREFWGLMK